jgi:glycosyltransferase involved in cell wall biosynthesis
MEAMPMAWLEALAMGKPFVGSKTGPGPEAVKDDETGLLCDPHDSIDIADKVIWMLQNKEAAQKMGLAARADVLERFNIEKLVKENIAFYQNCLNA